ncbi:hypothetical protein GV792_09655 [Nocardia cyriacigeorgica]|uniref:hypothetical protein n=1 Tax=Nocardia cyriacigeorgica TaxID=135487 RepID=UPI0013BBDE04|nr:hypothetical protein [Nocardia cyriacigeorgica]NEW50319.1 hypothetical protein [Nocardia cyriacigeorgica]
MSYEERPQVEITYDKDVPEDTRGVIDKSVGSLVERSTRNISRQRTQRALHSEFRAAEKEHLRRQIEFDAESKRAFDEAKANLKTTELNTELLGPSPLDEQTLKTGDLIRFGTATKIFTTCHFAWRWETHEGPFSLSDAATVGSPGNGGYAGISAYVNADVAHLNAHTGVGVALTVADVNSTTPVFVMGRALRWVRHEYSVFAAPGNGDGTSEGGVELTVLENGNFLAASPLHKIWRLRLSNAEVGSGGNLQDGFALDDPSLSVFWTMNPGSTYTFNLGVWSFVDCDDGIYGNSSAYGYIDSNIGFLSVFK